MSDVLEIDNDLAAGRIEAFAREGRLVQGKWHDGGGGGDGDDGGGRELACLLASIDPRINSASACPASLMPAWVASLTVRLFDGLPVGRVMDIGLAYGDRVRRWHVIDAAGWERVRKAFIQQVMDGALARLREIGAAKSPLWGKIAALVDRVAAGLKSESFTRAEWLELHKEASTIRAEAWRQYQAARRRATSSPPPAAAAWAEAAAAAWAEAAWAWAWAEEAWAAWAAAEEVWAEEAAWAWVEVEVAAWAAAKRRESYASSFETLLKVIDDEIASGSQGRSGGS
jgi:hypothetical protein